MIAVASKYTGRPRSQIQLFAEIIAHHGAIEALAMLGYPNPMFSNGYIISKPPRSPRLFWHYDWFCLGGPTELRTGSPPVFLMYYLSDTRPGNRCLRVIPGSHLNHNSLHDLLGTPHSEDLQMAADDKLQRIPDDWPEDARQKVEGLLARYDGDPETYGTQLYRQRGA